MTVWTHIYTKTKADRVEKELGYRISGHDAIRRPGQPDQIVKVYPAKKNQ